MAKLTLSQGIFEAILLPDVFWSFCTNGLTPGVEVAMGSTYSVVITGRGYRWPASSSSYVNTGQIVTCIIALPFFGYGSDRFSAQGCNTIHRPTTRLLLLFLPIYIGIIAAIIYGKAASHPESYNWFAIVWAYAGLSFCFAGVDINTVTFLLDLLPSRPGSMLIVICSFRGFVAFGFAVGVPKLVNQVGYAHTFQIYAGLIAAPGLLGVPVYLYSDSINTKAGEEQNERPLRATSGSD